MIAHVPVFPLPSAAVAVIVVLPAATAVTSPSLSTVATDVLLLVHVTNLFVAFIGLTVAVKVTFSPTFNVFVVSLKFTPVTGTGRCSDAD